LFTLIMVGLHEIVFAGSWIAFDELLAKNVWPHLQVDRGRSPPTDLLGEATRQVAVGHVILALAMPFVIYPLWIQMGGDMQDGWPGLWTAAWHLAVCILLQDTLFYWSHRTLHGRWLFRQVHRKHHRFRHVRGVTAEFSHTLEDLANTVSMFAPPILLGTPVSVFALWVAIRIFETVLAHSGYAFGGISSRHAFHHLHATKGCYGSFWGFWDRLMGTDKHWREWRTQQIHN
jgi:sterol desaturase/sphingolipid hydroxylase (fatty acid hydroxylase superfamily)